MKKFKPVTILLIVILFISNIYVLSADISGETIASYINDPPYPASNPTPPNNSLDIELDIILSWIAGDSDGDSLSYNVFFGTSSSPPNVEVVYYPNTYNPGLLEYSTQYYWRIDSYDNNGSATTGPLWTFTTKDNTPPNQAYNPLPVNGATGVVRTPTLNWDCSDPDDDPLTYDIYFSTLSNPPLLVLNHNEQEFSPGVLEYNEIYYWKIVANDNYGGSSTSPIWTFTATDDTLPYVPDDPIPDDESTDVPIQITLMWSGGDPDNDPVTYDLYFGKESTPDLEAEGLNVALYAPDQLDYNSVYYWRVVSTDDYGYTTNSPLWTFVTKENSAPYAPSDPVPSDAKTNVYIDSILSWQAEDPEDDVLTYDVYFGTEPIPPKVESNISISSYDPGDMDTTTEYYWRIVAWDSYNNYASLPVWSFITSIYENSPPEKPQRPSGPTTGKPKISYTYSFVTTDSNGEPIYYNFNWDDGTESGWIGPFNSDQTVSASHIWGSSGSYAVKVKAKDIYGGESFWSDPFIITMPKSKTRLLTILMERFPQFYRFLFYL